MEQPIGAALLERISWDDLRVFVVVARTLSFRKAATALRTSSSTVLRRMERLEETFGFRLFDRLPEGVGLTAEGRSVYRSAQQMELASHTLRAHLDQDMTTRGMVRCSVTEGLGTVWILPHLAGFSRTHPSTIVDLRCSMDIWMTYHPDARSTRRVAMFIDWLRTLFDPKRYAFFGDEFIHPRDLVGIAAPADAQKLFNLPILNPARKAQAR